eukprot:Opistho-1_new@59681
MATELNNLSSDSISFEILFYESPQPMWIFDCNTLAFLEVNNAAIEVYGYSKAEFLAMTIMDIRPKESFADVDMNAIDGQYTNNLETRHLYKNKLIKHVEVTTFPFSYNGIKARLAYARDVTAKRKRERLLEYLNIAGQELALALDTDTALRKISDLIVPTYTDWFTINILNGEQLDILLMINKDPDYETWSRQHRLKYPVTIHDDTIQGHVLRTGESLLTPVVTDEFLEKSIQNDDMLHTIKRMNVRSTMIVPMKVRNKVIGSINFISTVEGRAFDEIDLAFAKDMAIRIGLGLENARLHEQAQVEIKERIKAEQKKDEFISIASHELKTPITSLRAAVQILKRSFHKEPTAQIVPKLLDTADNSILKLTNLVEELLDVSKIEGGQIRLEKKVFNLYNLVNDCCLNTSMLGTHQFNISGDKDLEINADALRIEQVVINLLSNAIKYSPLAQQVEIHINKIGNQAEVIVKDKGIGIEEEKMQHLFDRYYRVDSSGLQYAGLGLGLYISAELIRMHGGKIGVTSKLGVGSSFWFTLPLN